MNHWWSCRFLFDFIFLDNLLLSLVLRNCRNCFFSFLLFLGLAAWRLGAGTWGVTRRVE
jgi:hypothetical protein